MQLFATYRSRATRNIWLAAEMGAAMDIVPVWQAYRIADLAAKDLPMHTKSPEFLAISPAGAIPVLKDGDLVLSESLAINLYIAQKTGGPMAAQGLAEQAQMTQWALYGMTAIEPHSLAIMYIHGEKRRNTDEGQASLATHMAEIERPLVALDTHLAKSGGYMVGGRFTVADINMAEIMRYAQAEPGLVQAYPAITNWLTACQARPAFRDMMAKRELEPANWA